MTDVEERLRTGLHRRAEATLPGDAVRAALAGRPRPDRRPAPVWLAVATAVAVIAIGVPLGLRFVGHRAPAARPTPPSVTLRVAWVPPGFTLRHLEAGPLTQLLEWENGRTDDPNGPSVMLTYTSTSDPDAAGIARAVPMSSPDTVRGRPALVRTTGQDAVTVAWLPSPDRLAQVVVRQVPDARSVAGEVAASVAPTAPWPVRAGMAFGWLPPGLRFTVAGVFGPSAAAGSSLLTASPSGGPTWTDLYVEVTPTPAGAGHGTPVLVRGLPGRYEDTAGSDLAMLSVQLLDGRWLSVYSNPRTGAPLSEAELVRVADGLVFESAADYSPLGR